MNRLNTPLPSYDCLYRRDQGFPDHGSAVWGDIPSMDLVETASGDQVPDLATRVQAFWTDEALYLRFEGKDPHIVATMTEHDDPIYEEDVVELFISEDGDQTRYKEFETNPINTKFDASVRWAPKSRIEVAVDWNAIGWRTTVEYLPEQALIRYLWMVPFANFDRGTPSEGDIRRVNIYRIDRSGDSEAADTYLAWSPTGIINFHVPERFGYFKFIR